MKKIALLMVALLAGLSFGRIGPVSQYGQLQAGKVGNGPGRIYGSCKGVTSGNEVAVQGMSLFWSIDQGDGGASFLDFRYCERACAKAEYSVDSCPYGRG